MEKKQYQDVLSLLTDEKFQLWLKGDGDETLNHEWQEWISQNSTNLKLYQEALKIWRFAQYRASQLPNIDEEWNKLQNNLSSANEQKISHSSKHIPIHQKSRTSRSWFGYAMAAAAVVVFALVIWTQEVFNSKTSASDMVSITTAFGERKTIDLPDNSSVILNANSTLRYPKNWSEASKNVLELTGEAYFSTVQPVNNPQHNFFVSTADGIIEVLGTRFNVYRRNHTTRVALVEGRVKIHPQKSEESDREFLNPTLLSPGEMAFFKKGEQQVHKKSELMGTYISWWKDALVFDNTPFREIINRLEETYGVQIHVSNKKMLNRKLSGSIENSNFRVIIKALSKVLQVPIHQEKQLIIFGQYTPS